MAGGQATVEKVTEPLVILDAFLAQTSRAFVDQRETATRSVEAKGVVGSALLYLRSEAEELVESLLALVQSTVGLAVGKLCTWCLAAGRATWVQSVNPVCRSYFACTALPMRAILQS
ncbi:MAG: hypothetical protein ABIU96_14815 [Rhodanobacter sp.]